ncbi:hypothetical protein WJX84_009521 [Apatococcus fuscideae]|uniref:Alpha-1,4 glucan phosphorylase n=1 Tax=Apatococcus fuscideae TaxID=2026836 RepID=A0AAW1SP60_9CHLO
MQLTRVDQQKQEAETEILRKIAYQVGVDAETVTAQQAYQGVAWTVRERLIDAFNKTQAYWREKDPKFIYYLSAEFLMGRTLTNAVNNLGLEGEFGEAIRKLGYSLEELQSQEQNASLGNGGLGRLAACFLDSIATLSLPGWGYGIRYRYGMFRQGLENGFQSESPDTWLTNGNPWEIPRRDLAYKIGFYGSVQDGKWQPAEQVYAVAYDNPIPGYGTKTVGNLRLFDCQPMSEFKLASFNEGKYSEATEDKRKAEDISAVLYPNDATEYGRELRLKQQIFFVSAAMQDTLARFKKTHKDMKELPSKACFQMNDTHPTIGVAELMRLLIDQEGLQWEAAWDITTKTLAFTNHTVMPEALEKWPVAVIGKLLPRHMEIIEKIDSIWIESLRKKVTAQVGSQSPKNALEKVAGAVKGALEEKTADPVEAALAKYSIITENPWEKGVKLVNMAFMATIGSKSTNGVAAIHSEIIKETIFKDFYELSPEKFQNKTNGVTPRRWLAYCNPGLSKLITETLGSNEWIAKTDQLAGLRKFSDDKAFQKKWRSIKLENKQRLADLIKSRVGISVPTNALYDVQIKRIHEYKRQHLNMFSVVNRYLNIKAASPEERKKMVPRVVVIGGKAASAYVMAKKMIKLVTAVGEVVNKDPDVGDLLKVVFLPDYNVSLAEVIVPGAEVSQHISTAGTEASGTSNMKFQMNGCLIIGTMDGANIEIAQESGKENMFVFGVDAKDIGRLREERKNFKVEDPRWNKIMQFLTSSTFEAGLFQDLVDNVNDMSKANDWFLLGNDFSDYLRAQDEIDALYKDQDAWTKRSILYTAGSGFFSSDRCIDQYAKEIWDVKPCEVPSS